MDLSLYHIEKEYIQLSNMLMESEGELSPDMETALEINKDNLQQKASNYAFLIKDMEAEAIAIEAEVKRLDDLKKKKLKVCERMKKAVVNAMTIYQVDKIASTYINLSLRQSERVEISNEDLIPDAFKEYSFSEKVSKADLKEALKSGQEIPGAALVKSFNLQIK